MSVTRLQWIGGRKNELAKNSTVSDLVNKPFKITEDRSFKDILRFKAIAAIVLKFAIPELKDKTLTEIARAIIDCNRTRKPDMTDAEVLDDEIDFLPSEAGVRSEKQTFNDTVFKVSIAGKNVAVELSCLESELTVNTEMQNRTTGLEYNLISRAVYYGASLLRDTVPAGDSSYAGIHKVYTVWLCSNELSDLGLKDELKERYVHTYSIWREYENHNYLYRDKNADLMRVVMIELPKLKEQDGPAAELLYKLFNQTQSIVSEIEKVTGVTLSQARKGVGGMIDYEARLQERLQEREVRLQKELQEREARLQEELQEELQEKEAELRSELESKSVRSIVKSWHRLGQDYNAAKAYVLEDYPDIDLELLDSIISEVYNLQETCL